MDKNQVDTAFEILIEEIEKLINNFIKEGEEVFKSQDFNGSKYFIETGKRLKQFSEKVKGLQKEWKMILRKNLSPSMRKRKNQVKLKRGIKTPEKEFIIPILESLIELGGKAEMKKVLDKVYEKMKDKLNQYDMEGLSSDPGQKRWKNTAQWARNTMVKKGLLSSDSPRGVWEITEQGKRKYNENREKV